MGFAKLIIRDKYSKKGYADTNYKNKDAADKLVRYVFKDHGKGKQVRFFGGLGIDMVTSERAVRQIKKLKKMYRKSDGRQMYHFILSFDERIKNPIEVYEIGLRIMDAFFYGWQMIFTVHEDTENLHLHFILNSVNMLTGYKWHMNGAEFREFKNKMENYADDYLKKKGHREPYGDFEDVAISELF